jgi:hypothetical protein
MFTANTFNSDGEFYAPTPDDEMPDRGQAPDDYTDYELYRILNEEESELRNRIVNG